jgi:creatinine amidohydrolase
MPRGISITTRIACTFVVLLAALSTHAQAQIYHAAEMTTELYRTLDRNKTVVILTDGILEEHGPYMPAYTDGYISEALVKDVAAAIVAKGWSALIFPSIPLGSGGANELAAKYPFPGTFAVRINTLRAIFMDLADELAEAGFRRIFIANNHGAPNHNRALDQVCDYFKETYGGQMIVLRGIPTAATARIDTDLRNMLSEQACKEDAASGHAGIGETSLMLFLQPKLVDPAYVTAPNRTAPGFGDMITVAKGLNWTGYFGAPRHSTAAYGALLYKSWSDQAVEQALKALDGTAQNVPGFAGNMASPPDAAALKRDESIEKRQREWLQKKGIKQRE